MDLKSKLLFGATLFGMLFILVSYTIKSTWKRYNYSNAFFSIELPQDPKVQDAGYFKQLTSSDNGVAYQVMYLKNDMDISSESDQTWFDQAFGAFGGQQDGQGKNLSEQGLKGQERKLKLAKVQGTVRVWLGKTRIYTLAIFEQSKYPSSQKMNRFFDSFKYEVPQNTTSQTTVSSNTSSNTSATAPPDTEFDAMAYFKSKTFPHISNIKDLGGWGSYFNLDMFVRNDLSDIKEKIETYGEDYIKTSYAGKEGFKFMNEYLPQIYPLFPQIIDKHLEGVPIKPTSKTEDYFKEAPRLLYLKKVADLAEDFKIVNPTAETKAAHKRAIETYNKAISAAPYVKGEYYKNNLGKVALFKEELAIGTATEKKESNILSPKNGKFLVGYFPNPLNSGQRYVGMKWRKKKETTFSQKLFIWKKEEVEFLRNNGAIGFNVFPNPDKLNYKSGYQYDVHLNVLKFLLNLSNGTHDIEVGFDRSKMANTEAEIGYNTFIFEMNETTRSEIQAIYDKLLQKRIEITMPFFCRDDRKMISNPEGFEKYGKLLKFNHTGTPAEVKDADWPHPVIGYNSNGWAAVERPDGTIEIIPIGLFKAVGGTVWKFTSLNQIPSLFEMNGNASLSSGRGEFGYLMKKENVSKCHEWE